VTAIHPSLEAHFEQVRTLTVIPAYNEETRLDKNAFIDALQNSKTLGVLFVDDGSKDNTARVLREIVALEPKRCAAIRLMKNAGKAEAVRAGMLVALSTRAQFVGYLDADLATPFSELHRLEEALLVSDERLLAMGSRVKLLGTEIHRLPARHYLGRVFATVASATLSLPVYDTQCGAKLFRRSEDVQALFAQPFDSRWIFDIEILARLIRLNRQLQHPEARVLRQIVEVPLTKWRDVTGSKVKAGDFASAAAQTLAIYRRYMRAGAVPLETRVEPRTFDLL
jgi:dolichyl-phosphate beta-glucosyltransferase